MLTCAPYIWRINGVNLLLQRQRCRVKIFTSYLTLKWFCLKFGEYQFVKNLQEKYILAGWASFSTNILSFNQTEIMALVAPHGIKLESQWLFLKTMGKKGWLPFYALGGKLKKTKNKRCARARVCECVLPPHTSPLMSSHWRSSHSQFLPWMRLSPGGWQVHCPHRHWPKKKKKQKQKETKSLSF